MKGTEDMTSNHLPNKCNLLNGIDTEKNFILLIYARPWLETFSAVFPLLRTVSPQDITIHKSFIDHINYDIV